VVNSATSDEPETIALVSEAEIILINRFSDDLDRESPLAREAIAYWAFALFQARGASHGKDLDDWLQAERALLAVLPVLGCSLSNA
jgi:hypothetical protein